MDHILTNRAVNGQTKYFCGCGFHTIDIEVATTHIQRAASEAMLKQTVSTVCAEAVAYAVEHGTMEHSRRLEGEGFRIDISAKITPALLDEKEQQIGNPSALAQIMQRLAESESNLQQARKLNEVLASRATAAEQEREDLLTWRRFHLEQLAMYGLIQHTPSAVLGHDTYAVVNTSTQEEWKADSILGALLMAMEPTIDVSACQTLAREQIRSAPSSEPIRSVARGDL